MKKFTQTILHPGPWDLFDYQVAPKHIENKIETIDLLERITEAATFYYVKNLGDSVAPNILCSKLPNKQYYVSINRYTKLSKSDKTIVFKSTKPTIREALIEAGKFLAKQKIVKANPLEELNDLLNG